MSDLTTELCGLKLSSPLLTASGCAGYGQEFFQVVDSRCLGAFVTKSATLHPRDGNEGCRVAETPAGMLNSIGLANPGIEQVMAEELENLQGRNLPIILSIAGFSPEEYASCIRIAEAHGGFDMYELNLSCPNVGDHGLALASTPEGIRTIMSQIRGLTRRPLLVKLKPEVADIALIARTAQDCGADGLVCCNTYTGMRIDIAKGRPVMAKGIGGFSGPAVFPMAVKNVFLVSQAVSIPVVGVGGIASARDVVEMMMAGASAVQIGAAALRQPEIFMKIHRDLETLLAKLRVERIQDIIGRVHRHD